MAKLMSMSEDYWISFSFLGCCFHRKKFKSLEKIPRSIMTSINYEMMHRLLRNNSTSCMTEIRQQIYTADSLTSVKILERCCWFERCPN